MKIKDIIKATAVSLNLENVIDYVDNSTSIGYTASEETLLEVNKLTTLSNLVISELASSFIKMKVKESDVGENGKIYFSGLSNKIIKVLRVLDADDKELKYKIYPTYVEALSANKIEYEYIPSNYGYNDEIGYSENEVTLNLLSYGVIAEYCLTVGRFDEAVMWRTRYIEDLSKSDKPKNTKVKAREWL